MVWRLFGPSGCGVWEASVALVLSLVVWDMIGDCCPDKKWNRRRRPCTKVKNDCAGFVPRLASFF